MPEVVHLVPSRAWGGAEQVAQTLHTLAVAHGWTSSLRLPATQGTPWTPPDVHTDKWLRWALDPLPPGALIHAHLPWPDRLGTVLVAARSAPLVVTFHLLPETPPWPRDVLLRVPSPSVFAFAGRLRSRVRWVGLSVHDQGVLSQRLHAPVTVIRNAPPAPEPSANPIVREGTSVRLLTVGRLEAQKGFDRLLRALAHPTLQDLPWTLVMIGEGTQRAALEGLVGSLGLASRVSFVGQRPAADGWTHADLLLAPSRCEGMPLVPLEAAEAGVPVVASEIPAHRELYATVPESLLPADEDRWPEPLHRWIVGNDNRRALGLAQRRVLGENPRETLWNAYSLLYSSVCKD